MLRVCVCISCLYSCGRTASENEFKGVDFVFMKPEGWDEVENTANTIIFYEKKLYELSDGSFNPVISVSGGENEYEIPEDFLEGTEIILSQTVADFRKVSSGNYGSSAKRLVYTGIMGETTLEWDMIFFTSGRMSYIITYTCMPKDYDAYINDFTSVADSFRFVKK